MTEMKRGTSNIELRTLNIEGRHCVRGRSMFDVRRSTFDVLSRGVGLPH